jgi:hypothetical protein
MEDTMIIQRNNVNVNGDACDVHARLGTADAFLGVIRWCAVYVRPNGPVNGYWYFPPEAEESALLSSLGVLPIGAIN